MMIGQMIAPSARMMLFASAISSENYVFQMIADRDCANYLVLELKNNQEPGASYFPAQNSFSRGI
jgi:hypothetical protein